MLDYLSPHFEEPAKRLRGKLRHTTNNAADEASNE
jgi:hypothetical protein